MPTNPSRRLSRRWRTAAVTVVAATGLSVGLSRGASPAAAGPTVQLYDVRDLIAGCKQWQDQADSGWRTRSTGTEFNGTNYRQTGMQQSARRAADSEQDLVDELQRLIHDNVRPESWQDDGGAVGYDRYYCGYLLVRQTPAAHREIAAFLARLPRPSGRAVSR